MILYNQRLYLTVVNICCCTLCYCCSATNLQWRRSVSNRTKHRCLTIVTQYDLANAADVTGRLYLHAESNFQNTFNALPTPKVFCLNKRTSFSSTV